MKKLTPKIIFIIILGLIFAVGMILLIKTPGGRKTGETNEKGLLSFFGDRKTKPQDETVVPGANTGTGSGDSGGGANGNDNGTGSGSSNGGNGSGASGKGSGSLSIKSVGMTTFGGGSGQSGVGSGGNGVGSTGNGGNVGGGTTGGTGTGGIIDPIIQVDCTPPQLPYTEEEIAELRNLTQRFYRIAANLHTDTDIENERLTRKSYLDIYNKTVDYTKQCYQQLKDPKYADKAKNSSARWHPYLTQGVIKRIATYDARVAVSASTAKKSLEDSIATIEAQLVYLKGLSIKNTAQKDLIASLETSLVSKKSELADLDTPTSPYFKDDIVGTFFTENVFKGQNLKVGRNNINSRRTKLFYLIKDIMIDNGDEDIFNCFMHKEYSPCKESDIENIDFPPYEILLKPFEDQVDLCNKEPGNKKCLNNAGNSGNDGFKSLVHKFQMLEDGLRVW